MLRLSSPTRSLKALITPPSYSYRRVSRQVARYSEYTVISTSNASLYLAAINMLLNKLSRMNPGIMCIEIRQEGGGILFLLGVDSSRVGQENTMR